MAAVIACAGELGLADMFCPTLNHHRSLAPCAGAPGRVKSMRASQLAPLDRVTCSPAALPRPFGPRVSVDEDKRLDAVNVRHADKHHLENQACNLDNIRAALAEGLDPHAMDRV
jgi:hypothetical protein